jgi:anoctamin-10
LLTLLLYLIPEKFLDTKTKIVIFSVFNLVYTTFLLKYWRRKCSELAYSWGTFNLHKWDVEPRLSYRGKIAIDPVTGRYRPKYPWWKTGMKVSRVRNFKILKDMKNAMKVFHYNNMRVTSTVIIMDSKVYCVSLPIVILCMMGAVATCHYYFKANDSLKPWKIEYQGTYGGLVLEYLPSCIYAIVVAIMTQYYRRVTEMLTEWGILRLTIIVINNN